jgi:hypothetical protein
MEKQSKPKIHKRTFSMGEINHLIAVLMENEREGWHYGNKEQYWKRHKSILEKLDYDFPNKIENN